VRSKHGQAIVIINAITLSRIALVVSALFFPSVLWWLIISVWAALSDFFDGYLARSLNAITKRGAQLDQTADKIFHFVMLICLYNIKMIHLYFIILFILREILILTFRYLDLSKESSNQFGKIKTFLTYALIVSLLLANYFYHFNSFNNNTLIIVSEIAILIVSYYSLVISMKTKIS
jgi:CDP-diacylglycerol--glycerol-3-phosphate 3-phosphatidyltransferase